MQWNRWVVDRKIFWKIVASLASALNDETPEKKIEALNATSREELTFFCAVFISATM